MTNKKCPICLGIGWVCENHITMPWDDELGCTRGCVTSNKAPPIL